jgi:hypothetical protein
MKPIKPIAWRRRAQQQALVRKFNEWMQSRLFVVSEQPGEGR